MKFLKRKKHKNKIVKLKVIKLKRENENKMQIVLKNVLQHKQQSINTQTHIK